MKGWLLFAIGVICTISLWQSGYQTSAAFLAGVGFVILIIGLAVEFLGLRKR